MFVKVYFTEHRLYTLQRCIIPFYFMDFMNTFIYPIIYEHS